MRTSRTREQIAANKADYDLYHLAHRVEKDLGADGNTLAKALRALRPLVRKKMHPVDVADTDG